MHHKWSLPLVVVLWSCTSVAGPEYAATAALNQPFELRVGERVRVERAGLELHFVEVGEDSRCPSNALILCVWEGDAAVVVEITPFEGTTRTDTLHITLDPKAVVVGSLLLRLERLDPYPEDVTPIPVDDHVASLVLTNMPFLSADPVYYPLHENPRFQALLQRMNLPQ